MIFIILGISLLLFGIGIIIDPTYYDRKHGMHYDFTGIEWYFGGLLVAIGVGFIWTEVRKRMKQSEQ